MSKHLILPLLALVWVLGCHKGYLALYKDRSPEPFQIFPCPVENLPEQDQAELTQGIQIRTQEALDQILEDFLS